MKNILVALTLLSAFSAYAGCEDGDSIAETAVIEKIKKQIPAYKKQCQFTIEFRDSIQNQKVYKELYDVSANCNGNVRKFEVLMEEYEDAVCGSAVAKETTGKASSRSILSYKNLKDFMDVASELAAEGASIEYFGYKESKAALKKLTCTKPKGNEVENFLEEVANSVDMNLKEQNTRALYLSAKEEWMNLIGNDNFEVCTGSTSGRMTLNHLKSFTSKNYTVVFEFGYED